MMTREQAESGAISEPPTIRRVKNAVVKGGHKHKSVRQSVPLRKLAIEGRRAAKGKVSSLVSTGNW